MSIGRRTVLTGAAAIFSAATFSLPRSAQAQRASTLRFVPYADLAVLDPVFSTNFVTRTHSLLVFEMLYGLDDQFRASPQMVEGATVDPDGLLWRLTLREGLLFHDGTPVLARDAVASLRRWAARDSFAAALMDATAELSAPDDRVIQFRMRRPFPLLPDALAKTGPYLPVIMPERLAKQPPNLQITEMVGSGPYRFIPTERVPGALAVYQRFEGYRPRSGGRSSFMAGPRVAHFDRIEWRTVPDNATAVSALAAGEVDWVEQPNIDLLPVMRRDANIKIDFVETLGLIGQIRFNHLHAPFDRPAVCRALLAAVDQQAMMDAVTGDDPAIKRGPVGIFAPGTPSASDAGMEVFAGKRDLAASKKALADAGYNGETIRFLAGVDVPRTNAICEVMADLCRSLGMNVDYVATDWGTVIQRILSDKPIAAGGWSCYGVYTGGLDTISPAGHLMIRGNGRAGIPSWLTDPELETLRTQWFAASDDASRIAIARSIQVEALKVGAYIPCLHYVPPTAYRKDLVDVSRGLPVFTGVRRV